jgi:hypothetical protein
MSRLEGQPNLTQFAEAVVDAASEQVRCAVPGVFTSVAADLRSAAVQPAISRQNSASADPSIPDVPIMFPRWRGGSITWPVQAGDQCLLVFADRSLDEWEDAGGSRVTTPDDPRTHDITDAIAIPIGIGSTGSGGGTLKIDCGTGGKVAIGNSTAELVSLLSQAVESIIGLSRGGTITENVVPGSPAIIDTDLATELAIIQVKLDSIKGSL